MPVIARISVYTAEPATSALNVIEANQSETTNLTSAPLKQASKLAISIVKFHQADWIEFESDFSNKIIKNEQLTNEEKLKFLYEACAMTEAEPILARLNTSDCSQALNKLSDTFAQTNFFVKQLLALKTLENPNAMDFGNLVKAVDNCMTRIKAHVKVGFDQLIPFIIIEKLDGGTRVLKVP